MLDIIFLYYKNINSYIKKKLGFITNFFLFLCLFICYIDSEGYYLISNVLISLFTDSFKATFSELNFQSIW